MYRPFLSMAVILTAVCSSCSSRNLSELTELELPLIMVGGEARVQPLGLSDHSQAIVALPVNGFTSTARMFTVTESLYVRVLIKLNSIEEQFDAVVSANPIVNFEISSGTNEFISLAYRSQAPLRENWRELRALRMFALSEGWMLLPANQEINIYMWMDVNEDMKQRYHLSDRLSVEVVLVPYPNDGVPCWRFPPESVAESGH